LDKFIHFTLFQFTQLYKFPPSADSGIFTMHQMQHRWMLPSEVDMVFDSTSLLGGRIL